MKTLGDFGAGNTLGRYELLMPIAQGGMALVWAARIKGSRGFQKLVAVKSMLPSLSEDDQFEKMFLEEAELASRIRHPNVCEILDLGEEDGTLYIVMELIFGEPLSALQKSAGAAGGIPLAIALKIVRDAARGLHAAHELKSDEGATLGLVHRDVSPQNLLVGFDGHVKIVDFGIAKVTANADGRTQAGQVKGKVPYMAPEQCAGRPLDRRTDIFALGIVLFHLVTGKHPFRESNDMATLRRIVEPLPAPRASAIAPETPPDVDALLARALEKNPAMRFDTMEDLAGAIDQIIAKLPPDKRGRESDVGPFMKRVLGDRAEKKKRGIKDAIKLAEQRSIERGTGVVSVDPASLPSGSTDLSGVSGLSGPFSSPSGSMPSGLSSTSGSISNVTSPTLDAPLQTGSGAAGGVPGPPSSVGSAPGLAADTLPPRSRSRVGIGIAGAAVVALIAGTVFVMTRERPEVAAPALSSAADAATRRAPAAAVSAPEAAVSTAPSAAPSAADAAPASDGEPSAAPPARHPERRRGGGARPKASASAAPQPAATATATATAPPAPTVTATVPRVLDPGF